MSSWLKLLIGLTATLFLGWLSHGPLGQGARLIDGLEAQARAEVAAGGVPGVSVSLGREPLSRFATLSGPANDFQRGGMGQLPGLNDRVGAIPGIAGIRWADAPADEGPRVTPLLLETLVSLVIAYLVGVAAGALLFRRKPRQGFY